MYLLYFCKFSDNIYLVATAKTYVNNRAQRCDSDGADSNVAALTVTALG